MFQTFLLSVSLDANSNITFKTYSLMLCKPFSWWERTNACNLINFFAHTIYCKVQHLHISQFFLLLRWMLLRLNWKLLSSSIELPFQITFIYYRNRKAFFSSIFRHCTLYLCLPLGFLPFMRSLYSYWISLFYLFTKFITSYCSFYLRLSLLGLPKFSLG